LKTTSYTTGTPLHMQLSTLLLFRTTADFTNAPQTTPSSIFPLI